MATLEQIAEKLDRVENGVIELRVVLLGKNSDTGMIGDVSSLKGEVDKLKGGYKTLIGVLIGSGVFTGGVVAGLVKLLGG